MSRRPDPAISTVLVRTPSRQDKNGVSLYNTPCLTGTKFHIRQRDNGARVEVLSIDRVSETSPDVAKTMAPEILEFQPSAQIEEWSRQGLETECSPGIVWSELLSACDHRYSQRQKFNEHSLW